MSCEWVKSQITLYLYNELDDPERVEIEQHVDGCPECSARLERERALYRMLDARERAATDASLLAACRMSLSEALEVQPRSRFGSTWMRIQNVFRSLHLNLQPSLAAVLLMAGFAGGWVSSSYRARVPVLTTGTANGADNLNLANITAIQAINSEPDGNLEIVFDTTRRRVIRGAPRDPNVEKLLVYAANHYSNPGIRLDSIELLKDRADDGEVRASLITALRTDQNPGVRLKALEALREFSGDGHVRTALLETLRKDGNPGVRIEAIEQLSKLRDASAVPVLRQLAEADPNNYVRMRSASALRDLNASEIY